MRHAGIDHLRRTRCRTKTQAIIRRAQMRAAFEHLARDAEGGMPWIVTLLDGRSAFAYTAAAGDLTALTIVRGAIPIRGPLPDVAGHVEEAVPIRRKRTDRRRARVAVFERVVVWKLAVPRVGHDLSARLHLVAPGVHRAVQTAARGEFPLGFGGKR